ncbi:sciellin isoform X2 [Eublepharis macularius]|uniref:Sciellin isoform X2 n=1 Tax=Eublepharis macularius TaxID=481883 RepID=A0AA97J3B6_EUBMA|nr:sciellin isoform X2 [Eublepharis macularius]
MATFTIAKSSPNKSDVKNASLAMKSRQQVINEVNKRRTLLQDNSWIKKQPEEETVDENYGRAVLNQYKSQDSLHRNAGEKEDQKALLSRYRSDTTLDRISDRNNVDKTNKLPTLDSRQNNGKELVVSGNMDSATSPVKKKRQSWMPPPVPGQKPTADYMEQNKRQSCPPHNTAAAVIINDIKLVPSTSDKPGGPKMTVSSSDPMTSPKPNNVNDQLRTRQVSPTKPSGSHVDRNTTTETTRSQDLDNLIQVNAAGDKSEKRNLNELIKVKPSSNGHSKGSQDLDNLIQGKPADANSQRGDLDDLIKAKPASNGCHKGTLDDLIKVNPSPNGYNKGGQDLDDFIDVNNTAPQNKRSQQLDDLIVIKSSTVDQNKKWTLEQDCESVSVPDKQVDTNHSYQVTRGSSYNASSGCYHPKETIVYTRTYENSKFPCDAYEDNVHGKSIQTVYSTSDRAVIEKEMCTYCRKPLGTDTKMILDALQICCHATCFQCEVCKGPLENLKAGDSIWIHKNTVHCEPCYSKVKASWIY